MNETIKNALRWIAIAAAGLVVLGFGGGATPGATPDAAPPPEPASGNAASLPELASADAVTPQELASAHSGSGGPGMEQLILNLSRPDEPGILILTHHKGNIRVTGYDGDVVVVSAILRYPEAAKTATGVRPVPGHALKLHALEKHNVVTVSTNSHERTIDLEIQVPHDFSLHVEKLDAGDVSGYYLSGEMEVTSSVGRVELIDATGSAVISTVDGDIFIRFSAVTPNTPMAFTSVGGDIDVSFPANMRATLKMRTDHGEIRSDLEIDMAGREAETETSPATGIQRAFLQEWTHGAIGGGGPQVMFKSYQGDITIRKTSNDSGGGK